MPLPSPHICLQTASHLCNKENQLSLFSPPAFLAQLFPSRLLSFSLLSSSPFISCLLSSSPPLCFQSPGRRSVLPPSSKPSPAPLGRLSAVAYSLFHALGACDCPPCGPSLPLLLPYFTLDPPPTNLCTPSFIVCTLKRESSRLLPRQPATI